MSRYKYTIEDQERTGAIFGLDITVGDDGRSIAIKQDDTWSELSNRQTSEVAVRVRNVDFNSGMYVHAGAIWSELAGTGVTLAWPNYRDRVHLQFLGSTGGAWTRGSPLPATLPAPPTSGTGVADFIIGDDGTLQPNFMQDTQWPVSDRPLIATEPDRTPRYTTVAKVSAALSTPTARDDRDYGQDQPLNELLVDSILSAEAQIDRVCGYRFEEASSRPSTRTFRTYHPHLLDTAYFVGAPTTVMVNGSALASTGWQVYQPAHDVVPGFGIQRIGGGTWPIDEDVGVTARFGFPTPFPPPMLVEAATRAGARHYSQTRSKTGMYMVGDDAGMYVLEKDIMQLLAPFRMKAVIG